MSAEDRSVSAHVITVKRPPMVTDSGPSAVLDVGLFAFQGWRVGKQVHPDHKAGLCRAQAADSVVSKKSLKPNATRLMRSLARLLTGLRLRPVGSVEERCRRRSDRPTWR